MRIIEAGHLYAVENIGGSGEQYIRFVRRRDDHGELLDGTRRTPGILTQELLRVAIDRTLYLYAEAPCDEDTRIVDYLRMALVLYESRAARRTIEQLGKPEEAEVCVVCHHILCKHKSEGAILKG